MKLWDPEEAKAYIDARERREKWYKPGIWMLWALKRRVLDSRREVKYAWQRVFRGWDDRACWSIDSHLSKHLGELLIAQAADAHGWPGTPWDFDTWVAALKENGEALLAYYNMDLTDGEEEYDRVYPKTQDALRWVADNFATLWD